MRDIKFEHCTNRKKISIFDCIYFDLTNVFMFSYYRKDTIRSTHKIYFAWFKADVNKGITLKGFICELPVLNFLIVLRTLWPAVFCFGPIVVSLTHSLCSFSIILVPLITIMTFLMLFIKVTQSLFNWLVITNFFFKSAILLCFDAHHEKVMRCS